MWASHQLLVSDNSYIANNRAGRGGGAFATNPQPSACLVSLFAGTVLENNTAPRGGAIWSYGNVLIGPRGTVRNHYAGIDGGAVWSGLGSTIEVIGESEVVGNVAENHGGAFYLSGPAKEPGDGSHVTPEQERRLHYYGDVLRAIDIDVNSSLISNNTARAGDGGVAYIDGANRFVVIDTSTLTNNSAPTGTAGAIYSGVRSRMEVRGTAQLSHNSAEQAGAFHLHSVSSLVVQDAARFEDNVAQQDGGAIFAELSETRREISPRFVHASTSCAATSVRGLQPGACPHTRGR